MSTPHIPTVETYTFHATKHAMYAQDPDGEWVIYLRAKNLQQLISLYRKHLAAGIPVDGFDTIPRLVRVQQVRTVTKVMTKRHTTLDLLDDLQVEAALSLDREIRKNRNKNRTNDN